MFCGSWLGVSAVEGLLWKFFSVGSLMPIMIIADYTVKANSNYLRHYIEGLGRFGVWGFRGCSGEADQMFRDERECVVEAPDSAMGFGVWAGGVLKSRMCR